MKYQFKRILVTGGAGCIGLNVCAELKARGIPFRLFDLPEQVARVQKSIPDNTDIYLGSILDLSSVRDALADCDAVIHLAAYLGVRRTENNRLRCMEINIDGTKNVLDCAIQHGVKKLVFASSSEVYGEPLANPISEKMITQGKTVYAISKLAGEELCKAYSQRFPHFKNTVLRFFNAYGPGQIAQFVIPKFIRNVMENRSPVVYGNGLQVRSYCYASDTAWATVEGLLNSSADDETINIGNSKNPLNLKDLATMVIKVAGKTGSLSPSIQGAFENTDRSKEREIFERFCDTSKAEKLLGFSPKVSLEEGIQKVMDAGPLAPKWETSDFEYTVDD